MTNHCFKFYLVQLLSLSTPIDAPSLFDRTYAKSLLKILVNHDQFDARWKAALKNEAKVKHLQKIVNSLRQ